VRTREMGYVGLVVILDSLEKLQGISQNFHDVLASAEAVFANNAPYLDLPVHAIYTVPPALLARQRFESVLFMPMIKLRDREGKPFQQGFDAAFQIVAHRVPRDVLNEMLGPTSMADRLQRIIA